MNRTDFLNLIEAALTAGQPAYARKCAEHSLADWPGDLAVQLTLAKAHAEEGQNALAARVLESLTAVDPADFRAQRLLGEQLLTLNQASDAVLAFANAHVGDGLGVARGVRRDSFSHHAAKVATTNLPEWAASTRAAYLAERIGDWETARREVEAALKAQPTSSLPALTHLCTYWHAGHFERALPLAEDYHARWPKVAAFKLCLAECLLALDSQARLRATELLHDAAAQDSAGQVARRHWGETHPYRALWKSESSLDLPGPLPAELVSALGYNRLKGGKSQTPNPTIQKDSSQAATFATPKSSRRQPAAEEIAEIQAELNALTQKIRPQNSSQVTHYVLLSSRTQLTKVFGLNGFTEIDTAMKTLAMHVALHTRLKVHAVYVDDPASLSPFGLRPVNPTHAWDIKILLGKLASRLAEKNETLSALLIVGGPDIIPFHHLPNPTDDVDPDIPSDNPYATPDENYFVPEWAVGRLPSGVSNNPTPLAHALHLAARAYGQQPKSMSHDWLQRFKWWLRAWWERPTLKPSLGYAADVWKEASATVYTAIGDPRDLLTSPPTDANWFPIKELGPQYVSYFNLHGIEDGPDWYGQRSADDHTSIEYPIALRPADVTNSGRAPVVVFSEACYGANVFGKSSGDALCLRFLECGTRALVSSTKIAYGSVIPPLIGADLLGRLFWQNVNAGLPVGEALRRAKLQMAQDMHDRQGFLDGEDQKTLISFILYGDPLATVPQIGPQKKTKQRPVPKFAEPPTTVCDKASNPGLTARESADIPPDMVAQIKSVVAQYLPGMSEAEWHVAHAHTHCTAPHDCPTSHLAKTQKGFKRDPHTLVVTLSKTLRINSRAHPHYARVTLDEKGAVIKLAVSR